MILFDKSLNIEKNQLEKLKEIDNKKTKQRTVMSQVKEIEEEKKNF